MFKTSIIPVQPPMPSVEAIINGTADLSGAVTSNLATISTGKAADLVLAGSADNTITTAAGTDIVEDQGGSDRINTGAGDDIVIYDATLNHAARDVINGGVGADALVLNLTSQDWLASALQSDIARIIAQMGTPAASGATLGHFKFSAFNLVTDGFEAVRVFVDGQEVTLANDPVTARADAFAVAEGGTVAGTVLANDTAPDRAASVKVITAPTEGQLTLAGDGSFTFSAASGFDGLAAGQTHDVSFVYRVTDANGDVADATATVTITGTNDLPVVAGTVTGMVVEDGLSHVTGALTAIDLDLTDTVTFAGSAVGNYGALTIDAAGNWAYDLKNTALATQHLAAGQVTNEVFTVTATDSQGAVVTQDITLQITGTNDAPTIGGSAHGVVGNVPTLQKAVGQLFVADVDGDALTVSSTGTATYGSFAVTSTGGWTYQLDPTLAAYQALTTGQSVTDSFVITVDDGHGGLAQRTVAIDVLGLAPQPGAMTLDMSPLADFAGLRMTPTILGTTILTNNQRQQIATAGPVSDFNIVFSTDFLTGGDFNTALTPNAHLRVIASNTVVGANVVTLAATHLVTDVFTGLGSDLISVRGGTAFGSTFDGGSGVDMFEVNNLLMGADQSIDASAMFTTGEIAVNGTANAYHVTDFEQFRFTGVNETVIATDHNDILIDRGQNTIFGGNGNDLLTSARVGTGIHSELYGGHGDDVFLMQGTAASRAGDVIDGGDGADKLTLQNVASFDASTASSFDVLTQGGTVHVSNIETLSMGGTAGNDSMTGGAGHDSLTGNFGDDLLTGGSGDDLVDGGWGNDTLSGDAGNNTLWGGVGDDWLTSFLGNDLLNGSVGADTFVLAPKASDGFTTTVFVQGLGMGDGADTVTGFNADTGTGHDVISLTQMHDAAGLLIGALDQVLALSTETVDGILMDFGAGNSLFLNGVTLAQLSVDDFTFA